MRRKHQALAALVVVSGLTLGAGSVPCPSPGSRRRFVTLMQRQSRARRLEPGQPLSNDPVGVVVAGAACRIRHSCSRASTLVRNWAGWLGARVSDMSMKRVAGGLIAVALLLGGGFLALAGMGYIGESAGTSRSWSTIGSLLAGLGVALAITIFPRRHG